jgi:hypothetical protein
MYNSVANKIIVTQKKKCIGTVQVQNINAMLFIFYDVLSTNNQDFIFYKDTTESGISASCLDILLNINSNDIMTATLYHNLKLDDFS